MNSVLRNRPQALLLFPLFVYLLLPLFGSVWHMVVPEHDHLLASVPEPDLFAPGGHSHLVGVTCETCGGLRLAPLETVIHAFDPISALQVFAIMIGLGALFVLLASRGRSTRVVWPALFLQSPLLLPLELPPSA